MHFCTLIGKNLFRRPVRSLLTASGVALAVGAVVALLGVARGFEDSLLQVLQGHGVDIVVTRAGKTDRMTSVLDQRWGPLVAGIEGVEKVAGALMDVVDFREANLIGVFIQGWPADSFVFEQLSVRSGRRLHPGDRQCVLLGAKLAEILQKGDGDTVEIEMQPFRVVGVYESYNLYENRSAIMPLEDFQRLMDRQGQVMAFHVMVRQGADKSSLVEEVCRQIETLADEHGRRLPLEARPAYDYVKSTLQIRQVQAMAWVTSVIACVIGAVGMLNTMIMSVFERTHEIGILRAIGWRKRRIVRMILGESLLLCLAGATLGVLAAVAGVYWLSTLPAVAGLVQGKISPVVIGQGYAIAVLVGLAGGLYPACRGAWLSPTEAIRHE